VISSVHHVNSIPKGTAFLKGIMTRDFNKQRQERNDMRPYVRKQPTRRPGAERSERPRLNRETVDRAWENGAQVNHADYHPRNSQQHSSRQYDQRQRFSGPGARNSSGYYRDYEHAPNDRESTDGRNGRYHNGNAGPRPRSYNNDRFNEPRSNSYRERNHETAFRRNERDHDYGNDRSDNRREQGYAGRPARYPEQERRSSRYNGRQQRPYANGTRPETRTPYRNNYRQNEREQFEGDYERFNSFDNHSGRRQPEERHVTHLPERRVLKGSRPAQRKNAQFWTEITEDANDLVPQAHQPEQAEQQEQKPAKRKREKKAATEPKSESNVPRPSQRGFKWPKPEV